MGNLRKFILIKLALVLTVLFQNCGEDLDLSSLQQASEGPGVSVVAPATYYENSDYTLTTLLNQITNPTAYAWYKDGLQITGETASSLSFTPIELTDAGSYEVRVTADGGEYSQSFTIVVQADPNPPMTQVFTDTYFTLANINYYIYSVANFDDAREQEIADNFCKGKVGANSVAVNYDINRNLQLTQRYAYVSDLATCQASNFDQGYVGGHCLYFLNLNINLMRYISVECQL